MAGEDETKTEEEEEDETHENLIFRLRPNENSSHTNSFRIIFCVASSTAHAYDIFRLCIHEKSSSVFVWEYYAHSLFDCVNFRNDEIEFVWCTLPNEK